MREGLMLDSMERYADHALLTMRVFVGAFLIWGVWDNVISAERMQEFVAFLDKFGFVAPQFMATLSVWVQLLIGISFLLGLLTRWAAVLCIINFAVAIIMVDRFGGLRGAFPSGCLVVIGLYLATRGAGRFSLDEIVSRRRGVRATASGQISEGAAG